MKITLFSCFSETLLPENLRGLNIHTEAFHTYLLFVILVSFIKRLEIRIVGNLILVINSKILSNVI